MRDEVELRIAGMIYNQSMGGTYSLILAEEENFHRRFSVLIGEAEAQSIALHLNKTKAPRPLSHDLMNTILRELHGKMQKVVIYKMQNDIFFSEIHLLQNETPIIIDSRTSDAIALAVRSDAPIFIKSDILDVVASDIKEEGLDMKKSDIEETQIDYDNVTIEDIKKISDEMLKDQLETALKLEKYEIAALIRDEMQARNLE